MASNIDGVSKTRLHQIKVQPSGVKLGKVQVVEKACKASQMSGPRIKTPINNTNAPMKNRVIGLDD
jgi:hypothetical protein